jgi:hypothetical protein
MSPLSNEAIAYYDPGDDLNGIATGAAVVGRRFLRVVAPKHPGSQALANDTIGGGIPVAHATGAAGQRPLGVSTYDCLQNKGVPIARGHKVFPVEAGAAMTAGDQVQSDGTGRAITLAAGVGCGTVLNSPTAAGQTAIVALDL